HPGRRRLGMARWISVSMTTTVLLLAAAGLHAQVSIADLTHRSSIIFSGTVERAHSETDEIPADDRNVVVRVERVLDTPAATGLLSAGGGLGGSEGSGGLCAERVAARAFA